MSLRQRRKQYAYLYKNESFPRWMHFFCKKDIFCPTFSIDIEAEKFRNYIK